MFEMLLANGSAKRKTIANIWNCLHLRNGNLYALGLPQKAGNNSGSLTYLNFTKIDINVLDVTLTAGSTLKLDTAYRLYGSGDNNSGCLGLGDATSRLTTWVAITPALDGKVVKLSNRGSTQSTLGILTDKGSLYMAGKRNAMGIGDGTETNNTTWIKSRNNVSDWATNDSKFSIVTQTDGYSYATGVYTSGTSGMFGNGRTSGTNSNFEGTPTTANTLAMNFAKVDCVGGTTIGITKTGDLYVAGMGWKVVGGVVTYTNLTTDILPTFTLLASNVQYYSMGGSGGGATWHGVGIAWTATTGLTRYIGTNYNGVAGSGSTYAQVPFYGSPTVMPYKLIGDSTWSWEGVYNGTPYQYAFYDTTLGMGFAGSYGGGSGLNNTTGTLQIISIPA